MRQMVRGLALAASLAVLPATAACAGMGMGGWEDVIGGSAQNYRIEGEVRSVDTRARTLELRTSNGRHARVRYDGRTDVVYRDRRYSPTALERGDWVSVSVRGDRYERGAYARSVRVLRSARHDGRYGDRGRDDGYRDDDYRGGRRMLGGRVERVDRSRGVFQLRTEDHGRVWVTLPSRPGSDVRARFRRLDRGDYVRVVGEFTDRERFRLRAFR